MPAERNSKPFASTPSDPVLTRGPTSSLPKIPPNSKPSPPNSSLVDTLMSAEWIHRRLRRVEAQLWNYRVECLDKSHPPLAPPIGFVPTKCPCIRGTAECET